MNLKKAIEILNHPPFYPSTPSDIDYANALKLGIEALKVQYIIKCQLSPKFYKPLPGETEDNPCQYKTIRDWPGCFEYCDHAATDECPYHKTED